SGHGGRGNNMKAEAKARGAELCASNDPCTVVGDLYSIALAGLPRALILAFAEPLLTPQPEPPRPPTWDTCDGEPAEHEFADALSSVGRLSVQQHNARFARAR